jgi:hypothetical protein
MTSPTAAIVIGSSGAGSGSDAGAPGLSSGAGAEVVGVAVEVEVAVGVAVGVEVGAVGRDRPAWAQADPRSTTARRARREAMPGSA